MQVRITYCAPCNYLPRTVGLTEQLLGEFADRIESWTLVPGKGGLFEVELDGELAYSKKATGRHPAAGEIKELIQARLAN